MGKKYEDEIREILKGFDDPEDRSRRPSSTDRGPFRGRGQTPGPSGPANPFGGFSPRNLNPQQIMGFALILILFAWVMQGPWARGFPDVFRFAGYVSLAGTILFIIALIAMLRARGTFGSGMTVGGGGREQRWRGQVINFPNRQPFWLRWRRSLSRLFSGRR